MTIGLVHLTVELIRSLVWRKYGSVDSMGNPNGSPDDTGAERNNYNVLAAVKPCIDTTRTGLSFPVVRSVNG